MGRQQFVEQLQALGFNPVVNGDRVTFPYVVPVGKFIGEEVTLGFVVNDDFPLNPPSGPHVSPQIRPITGGGGEHPLGGVHGSNFGSTWEYWSRPCNHWSTTGRTVRDYMAHIRHLWETQ